MKKVLAVIVFIIVSPLLAFEGSKTIENKSQRKGLFLRVAGGYCNETLAFYSSDKLDREDSYDAFAFNFQMGFALDEHLVVHLSHYSNYFNAPYHEGNDVKEKLYVESLNGIGVSYFFTQGASFFVSGSAGANIFSTLTQSNADVGTGYLLSLGYQFSNNFDIVWVVGKFATIESSSSDILSLEIESSELLIGYSF